MLHLPDKQQSSSYKEQSKSHLNPQLYRYHHEPVSSNLLRRDIPPILILLFFLLLIIITLSQILVVHTSRYGANFSSMQKLQEELKVMDESMEALLRDNVLPIDKWRLLFNIQTYLNRFDDLFHLFDNQTITNTHLKRLLDKSNEVLSKENSSSHLRENIENVQKKLKHIIEQKRTYCQEEPRHLCKTKHDILKLNSNDMF